MVVTAVEGGFPPARSRGCPFDPPQELLDRQEAGEIGRMRNWDGAEPWVIVGYDQAKEALLSDVLSADPQKPGWSEKSPAFSATLGAGRALRALDPPDHTRHRRVLMPKFTARSLSALTPQIEALVQEHLQQLQAMGPGPVDLIATYTLPIPLQVIRELMGVPDADSDLVAELSEIMFGDSSFEDAKRAGDELAAYFRQLIALREDDPDDRLVSTLLHDHVHQGEMSLDELVDTLSMLVVAGHETTANQMSLMLLHMLTEPTVLHELRTTEDPTVIANAIEEYLRYMSPTHQGRRRVATAEYQVGGAQICPAEPVIIADNVANRDPAQFSDPHAMDIHRTNARHHLAFGYGIHQCLGQHLARIEMRTAVPALLHAFPDMSLATDPETIDFKEGNTVYGIRSLPVHLHGATS
jgi:cytochrome P450